MDKHYWSENWFAHHVIKKNFSRLREEVSEARFESADDLRYVLSIIHQLETDLGRALLKVHSIADLLVDKGLVTNEELAGKAAELDAMDGNTDGMLHPMVFRTDQEHEETPSTRAYLIWAEKSVIAPDEFLADLEQEDLGQNEEE